MILLRTTYAPMFFLVTATFIGEPAFSCDEKANDVLGLLLELPSWPMARLVGKDDAGHFASLREDAEKITAIAARIDTFDLDDIRAGLVRYEKSTRYRPEIAFIINQYLFDIPGKDSRLTRHIIPAYTTLGAATSSLSPSWPWRAQGDGKMKFEVLSIGLVRNGPPYSAIRVFDEYRKHLGRRKAR